MASFNLRWNLEDAESITLNDSTESLEWCRGLEKEAESA